MADRPAPTARRIRVATELRKLRERAGMTSTEAARQLGSGSGQLSNVETARFGVSADRIRAMACTYDCSDQAFIDALINLAGDKTRGWWEQYRGILPAGLLDLAELEHHAIALRTAFTAHVPGLLQTNDHAREIFRHVIPAPTPPEVEHRVSYRIKRQDVLYRVDPVPYRTVIHEAALRMKIGGPEVARAQLEHLLDMSDQDHITIRVLPFDVGAFPARASRSTTRTGLYTSSTPCNWTSSTDRCSSTPKPIWTSTGGCSTSWRPSPCPRRSHGTSSTPSPNNSEGTPHAHPRVAEVVLLPGRRGLPPRRRLHHRRNGPPHRKRRPRPSHTFGRAHRLLRPSPHAEGDSAPRLTYPQEAYERPDRLTQGRGRAP